MKTSLWHMTVSILPFIPGIARWNRGDLSQTSAPDEIPIKYQTGRQLVRQWKTSMQVSTLFAYACLL